MKNTSYLFIVNLLDVTTRSPDVVAYDSDEDFKRESKAAIEEALPEATKRAKGFNPNIELPSVDYKKNGMVLLKVIEPENKTSLPVDVGFGFNLGLRITDYFDEPDKNREPVEVISCLNLQVAEETLTKLSEIFKAVRKEQKIVAISDYQNITVKSVYPKITKRPPFQAMH